MEIMDGLLDEKKWYAFLSDIVLNHKMNSAQIIDLFQFIRDKEYVDVVNRMMKMPLPATPRLVEVNKKGTNRKRKVFVFNDAEMFVFKMIAFLLKSYDHLFCENLYSFRSNRNVKNVLYDVTKRINIYNCYSYKIDIHDYFNSIDPVEMLELVKTKLPGEPKFYDFLSKILLNPVAIGESGKESVEKRGVMAGVPISGFLANLYLADMDFKFRDNGIIYVRYSDDIICFSYQKDEIDYCEAVIQEELAKRKLLINPKKVKKTMPSEQIEYLGFKFYDGNIDVADGNVQKIKGKLKRKAKSLYRWKCSKNASDERTIRAYIRFFMRKFYNNPSNGEITWCRWYFPVITTDKQLKTIDEYAVSCIRYLTTGRYGKKNYNLRYEQIKNAGYISLVNSFWKYKKGDYRTWELSDKQIERE